MRHRRPLLAWRLREAQQLDAADGVLCQQREVVLAAPELVLAVELAVPGWEGWESENVAGCHTMALK